MNHKYLKCPNCNSSSEHITDRIANRILALQNTDYNVLKCKCGIRYLYPRIEDNELDKLYNEEYFEDQTAHSTPEYYRDTVKSRYSKFNECLDKLESYLDETHDFQVSNIKFLDIGAGTGDMVQLARARKFQAEGLEYSEYGVKAALEQFNVQLSGKSISELESDAYNVIHTNHVFEHFNDPIKELYEIRRSLKPNGILYIEVPRQFDLIIRIKVVLGLYSREFNIHSIHHPYFYTQKSLTNILTNNGFSIIHAKTFTRSGNTVKFKKLIWRFLEVFRVGNIIEIYARKK